LVGTNDRVDKLLPDNIISIHRTNNQAELAEIYTAADVFVNPTREENFPTTHMEALACGTPVVAFNTGGCGEMLNDKCGVIVEKNNVDELCVSIHRIYEKRMFDCADCIEQSQKFNSKDKFEEYINLYI
jgi:glycosyltransferase involved in cell wall biosynthesis